MAYIKEYWDNKNDRITKAKTHTKYMQNRYAEEIELSIKNTKIYDTDFICNQATLKKNEIVLASTDSVSAILKYAEDNKKIAILNFSSYKNPGGMFMNGSRAQEECLCHESFLYNVLLRFTTKFYDWNNMHKNKALYLNRGLYSPNIRFIRDSESVLCDVITCAAPNKSAAQEYQNVSDKENTRVLKSRIKYVLDIAKDNDVDILILGAYGCGVFGQDAKEVAEIFKEYLTTTHKCFDKIVFAIPNVSDGNYKKFEKVLKGEN